MNLPLDHPVLQTLAWTLLHFLWQGALLGLAAKAGLWLLRGRSPQSRYLLACAAMLLMAAAPVATFLLLKAPTEPLAGPALLAVSRASTSASPAAARGVAGLPGAAWLGSALRPLLPWAVALWMAGVALLSLRLLGGWIWLLRLRTRLAEPAGTCWQMTVNALARRMRVKMDVRILRSWAVDTLMVVGWVKPLILVPAAALAGLAPEALEAVLAHELEHVRRHDYLVNLVQSVLEVLLFYHPTVWWLSAQVRQERELCCDDAAVALCGDPVLYARALAALEALRGHDIPATRLAPAAHGGTLMNRIQRLIAPTLPPSPTRRVGILAALAVTALGAGTAFRLQDAPKKAETSEAKPRTMNIMVHEDGHRLRVRTQGEVQVRPDANTDLRLADGASIEISGSEKDTVRRFKAVRAKGAETRSFSVNGKEAPVDPAWLSQRLDEIKKLEAKTAAARDRAKSAEGQAKVDEDKAQRLEVHVRKVGKDGKEIVTVNGDHLPYTEEGHGNRRIIIKSLDGSGHTRIEELPGGEGRERVFVFGGPDGKRMKIDVERMAREAGDHARALKLHGKDLEGLREHLKMIKPDLDFDFDFNFDFDGEDSPRVFRWNSRTPGPDGPHGEAFKEIEKHGQQKEVEVLRREIERLQHRLDRLQERLHKEGTPAPAAPPRPPRPPKASAAPSAGPTPKPSAVVPPAPPAPPRPPAPPPAPGSKI